MSEHKSDGSQPDKENDEPGIGRLAYGYPDPDELHKLLDEAEVSRKISNDSGVTWRTYSVAERLNILVGGYKLAERELSDGKTYGEIEEWEARLCPEDYGFDEYIPLLERRVGERDVTIANLTAAINAMNRTPPSAGVACKPVPAIVADLEKQCAQIAESNAIDEGGWEAVIINRGDALKIIAALRTPQSATEERMKIGWMRPDDAANSLRGELDESGAADGCVVRLDAGHEKHDGGPYLRQAWYDAAQDAFVCSSTGSVLRNVAAWAYDFSEEDEARASVGPRATDNRDSTKGKT